MLGALSRLLQPLLPVARASSAMTAQVQFVKSLLIDIAIDSGEDQGEVCRLLVV